RSFIFLLVPEPQSESQIPAMPASRSSWLFICLLPALVATQCVHEGRMVPNGGLLPNPSGDACFDRVCRCESWDRCRFELERKSVLAKVNEQRQAEADSQQGSALVRTLECKCVEDLEGSHEMSFFCASRRSGNQTGCVDADGSLRQPGQRVSVETSGGESLFCECDANGHYVNCASQDDLRDDDGCQDEAGARVALGAAYKRTLLLNGRSVSLECVCTKSDQETACVRLE
ncbi:hypothetical protein BOX15_Mlig023221g2, partial [Macrostomum lignano]